MPLKKLSPFKAVLWTMNPDPYGSTIDSEFLDPDPYWECGSESRSMDIDQS